MPPELLAFAAVVALLGGPVGIALLTRWIARREVRAALRRLRFRRERRTARVREVFSRPPARPIGFLSHLVTRDSEPPSGALVHVLPAREAYVHHPAPTLDTRGLVRPKCRTRGPV